jgi:hypothetical protein
MEETNIIREGADFFSKPGARHIQEQEEHDSFVHLNGFLCYFICHVST